MKNKHSTHQKNKLGSRLRTPEVWYNAFLLHASCRHRDRRRHKGNVSLLLQEIESGITSPVDAATWISVGISIPGLVYTRLILSKCSEGS